MYEKQTEESTELRNIRPEHFSHEGVALIGFETAKALWETDQNVRFVCVLDEQHFKNTVIDRSEWIPLNRIETEFGERIPHKEQMIILYCANYECPQSIQAAKMLKEMGYNHVLDYKGGIEEWEKNGMPVQRKEQTRAA